MNLISPLLTQSSYCSNQWQQTEGRMPLIPSSSSRCVFWSRLLVVQLSATQSTFFWRDAQPPQVYAISKGVGIIHLAAQWLLYPHQLINIVRGLFLLASMGRTVIPTGTSQFAYLVPLLPGPDLFDHQQLFKYMACGTNSVPTFVSLTNQRQASLSAGIMHKKLTAGLLSVPTIGTTFAWLHGGMVAAAGHGGDEWASGGSYRAVWHSTTSSFTHYMEIFRTGAKSWVTSAMSWVRNTGSGHLIKCLYLEWFTKFIKQNIYKPTNVFHHK